MFGVSFKAKWSLNIVKNVLGKYGRWWWGRKSIFEDYRSHLCRMVYPGVFDQICCVSSQGNVVFTYFRENCSVLGWVPPFLSEHHWRPRHPPLLHVPAPQQTLLRILPGVHRKGGSDIQNSEDSPNLQTLETHHGA